MTTLYRFYGRHANLLYVGISLDIAQRWRDHRDTKWWWWEVAAITLQHFDTRREALEAERYAIQTEMPQHNIDHAVRRPCGSYHDYVSIGKDCCRQVKNYKCPGESCSKTVFYSRREGRFFHTDGSENIGCWVSSSRADRPGPPLLWTVEIPLPSRSQYGLTYN